jgi:hypothetical protein
MTTPIDPDDYLSEGGSSKYMELYVPTWGQDGSGNALSSFLRLGDTTESVPSTQWQQALLEQFTDAYPSGTGGFFDDQRQRYDPGATNTAAQQSLPGITGAQPDGSLTVAQREAETAVLQSKGGWMDHSDGNRITTTQGDKVEVIRGNYQLIVLGRQDDASNGALMDFSGGMFQPNDATPSNTMRLEWVRNYDGTWRIIEECQKGDVHTVVHGDVVEEQYGQSITAITGSELQPVLSDPEQYTSNPLGADGTSDPALYTQNTDLFDPNSPDYLGAGNVETKLNPTILEKTWAQSISSYTGSSACRIPTIHEETWAQAITEVTNCSGTIHSTTIAGVVEEVTEVGSINEVTTVGSAIGITVAASMAEVTVAGIQLEAALIPLHASIEVGAQIDISLGGKLELSAPNRLQIGLEDGKFVSAAQRATEDETRITATENALALISNSLMQAKTTLAEEVVHLGVEYELVAAEVSLGA